MKIELVRAVRLDVVPSNAVPEDLVVYNNRSKALSIYIGRNRPTPAGVSIDAALILDIDADGEIYSMELLVPPARWRRSGEHDPPKNSRKGRLVFLDALGGSLQLDTKLVVFKNASSQTISCRITDQPSNDLRAVRISRHVVVGVRGEDLCELWVAGVPL